MTKKYLILSFFLTVFVSGLKAQINSDFARNSYAEKIYIQTDNEIYTLNNSIWFKAVVVNAATLSGEYCSAVLYVDLIDRTKSIIDSKIIKLNKGIGSGSFDLKSDYKPGNYVMRAYTEWSKNFGDEFIFKKRIPIYSNKEDFQSISDPIYNINLTDTIGTYNTYKANLNPKLLSDISKRKTEIYIKFNDEKKSVPLKKGRDGTFFVEFQAPKATSKLTLGIEEDLETIYETNITANTNYVDLQFFPESGSFVEGLSSKVGFKAIDINGLGIKVKGEILDGNNNPVTTFSSNSLGMGHFILKNVRGKDNYKAKITSVNNKQVERYLDLPKVNTTGYVMRVEDLKNNIVVGVNSNYNKNGKIILKGSSRGIQYFEGNASLSDGQFIFNIPKSEFPEGIAIFTLYDEDLNPRAERLFYVENEMSRISVNASLNKAYYNTREKIDITLAHDQSFKSTSSEYSSSVLVLDKSRFTQEQNILSYLLLSSDLRGQIESAHLYFSDSVNYKVDDLMLTQGWRKYKYKNDFNTNFKYKSENGISFKGVVNLINAKKDSRMLEFAVMSFGDSTSIYNASIMAPGSFNFELDNLYGDEKEILFKPLGLSDKEIKKTYIALSKKPILPVGEIDESYTTINDSIKAKVLEQNKTFEEVENNYFADIDGVTKLDEVLVNAYKMTPKRKLMAKKYGAPDVVIEGKEIRKKITNNTKGLYNVLFAFPDKVTVTRSNFCAGAMCAPYLQVETTNGGKGHKNLVVIDGIPVNEVDYPVLQDLSPKEITSFEIIDEPKGLKRLYALVKNTFPPQGILFGSIISIYTRNGTGLYGALRPRKENNTFIVQAFSPEKEFYTPEHNANLAFDSDKPDLRSTIYWNPSIELGEDISYYHSDNEGDFIVLIETITNSGKIGFKQLEYSVSKSNTN